VSGHQKISVSSQAEIPVDKGMSKRSAKAMAVAQRKCGPALKIAYLGNDP